MCVMSINDKVPIDMLLLRVHHSSEESAVDPRVLGVADGVRVVVPGSRVNTKLDNSDHLSSLEAR